MFRKLMTPLIFAKLGYKVNTKLSKIESTELSFFRFNEPDFTELEINIVDGLKQKISFYNRLLNDINDFQPYIKKGYEYRLKNEDPEIQKIVTDLNLSHDLYLKPLLERVDVPHPLKSDLDKITEVFVAIAKGYSIGRYVPYLENLYEIAMVNSSYFSNLYMPITREDLENELRFANILNKIGINLEETLAGYETQIKIISGLKKEFLSIQTPDITKTITDRIEILTQKVKKSEDKIWSRDSLHRIGYLIAIRGENPKIFELLKDNDPKVKYDLLYQYTGEFKGDDISNSKKMLLFILEGYAYSYHIKFLEDELKKLSSSTDNEIVNSIIKLRWLGQKNQLYDVLRELKGKGFVGNSYEDLAVFLKQNVDAFKNTSLSTIQKEIGKDKRPPKNKRINLGT
jgi:hypothetical protein